MGWSFEERGNRSTLRKPIGAEKRTNKLLNPHLTPDLGKEPGPHWWEASALTTAPSLHLSCPFRQNTGITRTLSLHLSLRIHLSEINFKIWRKIVARRESENTVPNQKSKPELFQKCLAHYALN